MQNSSVIISGIPYIIVHVLNGIQIFLQIKYLYFTQYLFQFKFRQDIGKVFPIYKVISSLHYVQGVSFLCPFIKKSTFFSISELYNFNELSYFFLRLFIVGFSYLLLSCISLSCFSEDMTFLSTRKAAVTPAFSPTITVLARNEWCAILDFAQYALQMRLKKHRKSVTRWDLRK